MYSSSDRAVLKISMSKEYNSKLISKLYKEKDDDKILEILEEMDEIGDPYFLYPIYDKYKGKENSYISHYFLSSIAKFKSEEAKNIVRGIALDIETNKKNFLWILDYLSQIDIYDSTIVKRAQHCLSVFDEKEDEFTLDSILSYLEKAKALEGQIDIIKAIFEGENFSSRVRKVALHHLLGINSKQYFQYFFDKYENIKRDETAERIFAQEITKWKDGIIPEFKQKILQEGGNRAREIIEKHLKIKKEKEQKKKGEKEKEKAVKYSNASLITGIYELRENINNIALTKWDFKLFPESEILYKQNETAQNRSMLVDYCNDLRSLLKGIDSKCDHEKGLIEAKKIISGIKSEDDLKKPLNRLYLYLHSQGLTIDNKIFGLRDLNNILNLISHPEARNHLMKLLKRANLIDAWNLQEWAKIHRRLLGMYKVALEKLHSTLLRA